MKHLFSIKNNTTNKVLSDQFDNKQTAKLARNTYCEQSGWVAPKRDKNDPRHPNCEGMPFSVVKGPDHPFYAK